MTLTKQLLVAGGDARLMLDAHSLRNQYGCALQPEPALGAFGSCTASGTDLHLIGQP